MSEPALHPYLIVGLGNPGRRFRNSRHNIGFMLVDALAREMDVAFSRHQHQALLTDGRLEGARVFLAKPQTFMNLVGTSVGPLARYYRIPTESVVIVFDDLDLPLGNTRLRGEGGSGGHRGMESILGALGSERVPRLRLGIGRPPGRKDPADFVLEDFGDDEEDLVDGLIDRGVACLRTFVRDGLERAMSTFNPASG
ncbi:MAG TPA: aminoacyl-tRNA hydrolase [Anaerolineales bacterium]|nr:aminoacyl-tRNA hydrolase [Anaerolineales bacterium]